MDSPLFGDVGASTIGKRVRKRRNVDFLLGKIDILIIIPDKDASNLSKGMDIEAIELPLEPKEEPKDGYDLGDGEFMRKPEVGFQTALIFYSSPMKDNDVAGSSLSHLVPPGIFLP